MSCGGEAREQVGPRRRDGRQTGSGQVGLFN